MKGYLYSFILALFVLTGAWGPDAACAQGHEKSVSHVVQGKVVDADGLPLVGVNVIVKNQLRVHLMVQKPVHFQDLAGFDLALGENALLEKLHIAPSSHNH